MGGSLIRIKIMLFNLIYLKICWQDRIESNYVSHSDGLVHWFRLVTWQALFPIHEGLSRGTNKALFSSRRPVHWSPGKQKRISNMKEEDTACSTITYHAKLQCTQQTAECSKGARRGRRFGWNERRKTIIEQKGLGNPRKKSSDSESWYAEAVCLAF